jgi:hypothetical protein
VRYRVNAASIELIHLCILALIPNALCIFVDISLVVSYSDPLRRCPASKPVDKPAGWLDI